MANIKLGLIVCCAFLFVRAKLRLFPLAPLTPSRDQIFGIVGLALDASVLEAKRKYNCDWMNQLTGYFDYTASAAFGFGIFAALISFLFGLIRTQRPSGRREVLCALSHLCDAVLIICFMVSGLSTFFKIVVCVITLTLWVMVCIAGGLTSQYATKLNDLNDNSGLGFFTCGKARKYAVGGAVLHWLCFLDLVRRHHYAASLFVPMPRCCRSCRDRSS